MEIIRPYICIRQGQWCVYESRTSEKPLEKSRSYEDACIDAASIYYESKEEVMQDQKEKYLTWLESVSIFNKNRPEDSEDIFQNKEFMNSIFCKIAGYLSHD